MTATATTSTTILVVEDEDKLAAVLCDYLRAAGYAPVTCGNGLQALERFQQLQPALVLLDLMLPGLDGTEVCRALRRHSEVPIIMVTARVDEVDRLLGLEIGADDYVCKPFSPREVVARVRALLRRSQGRVAEAGMVLHGFRLDDDNLRACWGEHVLPLTPVEYRLLRALVGQPERVFPRAQLLDLMHPGWRDTSDRAVDSHVKNLRKKLAAAAPSHSFIHSGYGQGYRYEVAEAASADEAAAKPTSSRLPAVATSAEAAVSVPAELKDRLPKFIASRQALLQDLSDAAGRGDRAQVQHLAHRLAGSFSLYGYHWAAQRCLRIELEAETAGADSVMADVQAMQQHLQQATVRFDDQPPGTT